MPDFHREKGRFAPHFCIPGYNWCGPGCSGPGAPVNRTDAACKEHDLCYKYTGNYCACDTMFINELASIENPYTKEGRDARRMKQYMKTQRFFTCMF